LELKHRMRNIESQFIFYDSLHVSFPVFCLHYNIWPEFLIAFTFNFKDVALRNIESILFVKHQTYADPFQI
jgi:hypothetical protein